MTVMMMFLEWRFLTPSMRNKLILGTVQFGLNYGINNKKGQMSEDQVFKILDFAFDSNICCLDTAAAYGNSEERIGRYLFANKGKEFSIITKFNLKTGHTPVQSLENSLQRLQIDKVETIMFHNYEDFISTTTEDLDTLLKLKGKIFSKLGISLYTNEQIDEISKTNLFQVIQIPFNALDNEYLRGKKLRELKDKGIEVHARSVFLQGLFFMAQNRIPIKLQPLIPQLNELKAIAARSNVSVSKLVLHYAISKKYIDSVLIGVDSEEQLKSNLNMLDVSIDQNATGLLDLLKVENTSLLNPATWIE
jgi:aryl-alcohol dehydrogenase-like predicted oxidoreductase